MKQLKMIASAEWHFWLRSYLVVGGAALFALLLVVTTVLTAVRIDVEAHSRAHQQSEAEDTFLAQPDRHPHRMVHYGHYVFRNPAPLSIFDPGLDPVTGQSIFLEGHHQNTAMFAASGASADFGGLSWLTPAMIYQLFAPLLLILLGHAAIVRERESKVLGSLLAQGINGQTILLGKALAIISFVLLLLTPMFVSSVISLTKGESVLAVLVLNVSYFIYLAVWTLITLIISTVCIKRSNVLATLTALWLGLTLVVPSIAVNIAAHVSPIAGKIETDLVMLNDLKKLGDGHNANDPAFVKLRNDLLKQHGVASVDELPVNFRGVVASYSEKKLTDVMNSYAEKRMAGEERQANILSAHGWLTPNLAIASASRSISGTDLAHFHQFLRDAETLRFDFVQGLNKSHIESLSYEDDMNRNKDEASWQKARVDASNWEVLDRFEFKPAAATTRLAYASESIGMLIVWCVMLTAGLLFAARRLKP